MSTKIVFWAKSACVSTTVSMFIEANLLNQVMDLEF